MNIIEMRNINKLYRVGKESFVGLDDVSLNIMQGEMIAIAGPSGSGKTTLLNIVGLVDSFNSGSYSFLGRDISAYKDKQLAKIRNKEIGYVFQDFSLLPNESAIYNVSVPMYFDKTPFRRIKKRAIDALTNVGLPKEEYNKPVKYLSGGQKQRVAIARATVNNPLVILADEPTGALDSDSSRQIMDLFKELNKSGLTIVVVTHDKSISSYCNRVISIVDGKVKEGYIY